MAKANTYQLITKRIYDSATEGDGLRVLVDRLWPRGISKERAALGLWAKDVAPSRELRTWFAHRDDRYEEFSTRYRLELEESDATAAFVDECKDALSHENVTLLYAAGKDLPNHAEVLKGWLVERLDHVSEPPS